MDKDKIGRKVWYKGREGAIQGTAIDSDGQICYLVKTQETVFRKKLKIEWQIALFPIYEVKYYDPDTLAAKTGSFYCGSSYFNCNRGLDPNVKCDKCPIRICGMTPKEFYGTDNCQTASELDKLYKNKEEILDMFKDMDMKAKHYEEKENRKW